MENFKNTLCLNVSSGHSHIYPIFIGQHLSKNIGQFLIGVSSRILIVTDEMIAKLYLPSLKKQLQNFDVFDIILPVGEAFKNFDSLQLILNKLISHKFDRQSTVIALGGGVIGDLAGFAASIFMRGIDFIQLPTTLLSQIDSSIGGKTAINHSLGKNLIGSFYPPKMVIIDTQFLHSLKRRTIQSGLGEVVKYAIIAGDSFFNEILAYALENSISLNYEIIIHKSLKIKKNVIEKDEFDNAERAILNLGHTFAHGLEYASDYKTLEHGEAVAIGLYCMALLSYRLKYISKELVDKIDKLLSALHLCRRIPQKIDVKKIFHGMLKDKKNKNNQCHFILIKQLGDCFIEQVSDVEMIKSVLIDAKKGDICYE